MCTPMFVGLVVLKVFIFHSFHYRYHFDGVGGVGDPDLLDNANLDEGDGLGGHTDLVGRIEVALSASYLDIGTVALTVEQLDNPGVKYIARAGRKDPQDELVDLEKAAWHIQREIERLRKGVYKDGGTEKP